jgi:raffinose/stachyose/melibiose transport system substrate-binding protein
MKRKRFWKRAAVLGVVLFFCATAAGKRQDGSRVEERTPVELTFFLRKRETIHIFESIIESFNVSQDEVTVRAVVVPNPDIELEMRAVRGEFPDIVEMIGSSEETVRKYAKGGYLAPLDGLGLLERMTDPEGYGPWLQTDGKTYILPLSVNFKGIFLNCGLLERAGYGIPESWEEFRELLETIRADGELAMIFPDGDTWTYAQGWDTVYGAEWGNRSEAVRMAAEGILPLQENEGIVESLERYLELRRFGQEESWKTGYDEALRRFAGGEAYMFMQGNWAYSAIKKQNPKIRLAFIPFPADGREGKVYVKLDASIALSASCEHPEAARVFLDYLLSEEVAREYAERTGSYSLIRGGNGDLSFAERFTEKFEKGWFELDTGIASGYVDTMCDQMIQKLIMEPEETDILDCLAGVSEAARSRREEISGDRGGARSG